MTERAAEMYNPYWGHIPMSLKIEAGLRQKRKVSEVDFASAVKRAHQDAWTRGIEDYVYTYEDAKRNGVL